MISADADMITICNAIGNPLATTTFRIAGSAWASTIAAYVSLIGLLTHIYAKDLLIRLRGAEWRYLIPDPAILNVVVAKGFPMALQMVILSASALIMIGLINREGVITAAAYGVTQQLWNYISMPAMAVGGAVSAMTAQNIGANRWDRVSRITRAGVIFSLIVTTSMVVLLALVDREALGLFLAQNSPAMPIARHRSEERRVGKECGQMCRSRWSPYH